MAQYQRKQRLKSQIKTILRDILNFNGTQYATLSEPVVLDGDFEIEFVVCPTNIEGVDETLIGRSDDNRGFIRINQGYIHVNMTQASSHAIFGSLPILENNKIQRIVVRRIGSDVTVAYAEQSETITVADLSNNSFDWIGAKAGLLTFDGIFFSTRIWKDGDRNTGELVTNLRLDEPDTIYQRNYASPIADENDPDWSGAILQNVLPGDWEEISKKSGDDFWVDEDGERIYYAEGAL